MNPGPDPNVDAGMIEQARRQINKLAEEIAHLSEMDLAPPQYFAEFLQRLLLAIAAPAGAVWLRTAQGNLQLQFQINMREVGLDRSEQARQSHDELLRQALLRGQPALFAPQSSLGPPEGGGTAPGNPTDFVLLLAPIVVEKQVAGLVEVWQDPQRGPDAQRGFLQFIIRMAALAAGFMRNCQLRQITGQQQTWTQLEAFARQVHSSLNPVEVAYVVANEGRRLVECDRVSVAIREAKRAHVKAISGADVVEKRSNLVRLMRALFEAVMHWGERLVYKGTRDDTLPPRVNKALDAYLAESNSKLLVILPLRDERESDHKKLCRSLLMMECFEPNLAAEQLIARLEVVSKHAAPALYNAAEHRRIPFRWIWYPLAAVQEGLGGKTRAILWLVLVGLIALTAAMVFIPYPLRMDANGQLLPKKRAWIYSPIEGQVKDFRPGLMPGSFVSANQEVILMNSLDLADKIRKLQTEVITAKRQFDHLSLAVQMAKDTDRTQLQMDRLQAEATFRAKSDELLELRKRTNADLHNPGNFWLRSPLAGIVLTSDFRENLPNRNVKPSDPLLRIGYVHPQKPDIADWEIELKIPQKHIGQVRTAFKTLGMDKDLDVDLLLMSMPTATYKGKLSRLKVAEEAIPDRTENNEAEPVVLAWVRIHGEDIPPETQIPVEQLKTGIEVHSRIRCGNYPMGYSLFYGVWEFIYEKVIFFFSF